MARNLRTGTRGEGRKGAPTGAAVLTAQVPPTTLTECLGACAAHSGKLVTTLDRKRIELAEKLRAALALYATEVTPESDPAASSGATTSGLFRRAVRAPSGGGVGSSGSALSNKLLDALLDVGSKALECTYDDELRLALLISSGILTERKGSRAGWRLRARALEAAGDEDGAIAAYQQYLDRTSEDGFGVAAKMAGLRISRQRQAEAVELLELECPSAAMYANDPATDSWAEGLARSATGDWVGAEPRLVGALLALGREADTAADFESGLGEYVDLRIARQNTGAPTNSGTPATSGTGNGAGIAALSDLIGLYADQRRARRRGPVEDPTFGGTTWLSLGEFRNLISGKSICLIANSQSLGSSSLGSEIDSYDLVVRFNSYRIDAKATGTKTDIHASIHKHAYNWDKHVTTRLIFGGLSRDWTLSLRNRLVPGAQRYLGDDSLRWPLRNIGKVGNEAWPSIPTTGFNMLWLLDFLDVSPQLDLFGFDFYESGAYRVKEAMRQPITSVHEYRGEKSWVMERATSVTETRISLR